MIAVTNVVEDRIMIRGGVRMKKNVICIFMLIAVVALAICSWFVLPDVVTVQINHKGQATNALPKALAIAIPTIITFAGSIWQMWWKDEKNVKGYVVAIVGIFVMIATILFNR